MNFSYDDFIASIDLERLYERVLEKAEVYETPTQQMQFAAFNFSIELLALYHKWLFSARTPLQ